jgi:hypothetical protein
MEVERWKLKDGRWKMEDEPTAHNLQPFFRKNFVPLLLCNFLT